MRPPPAAACRRAFVGQCGGRRGDRGCGSAAVSLELVANAVAIGRRSASAAVDPGLPAAPGTPIASAGAEPPPLSRADAHHLDWLEAEAIHILREVAGQCANPALLFSGGKDSLVLLRLAEKAFRPGPFPFPLLHIDTGHNFPEVIDTSRPARRRTRRAADRALGRDSIAAGRVVLKRPEESRNAHQSVTLLDAIAEFEFDACIGGARRDEEKARAKERIFSFRDAFGQWDPKNQRPELWNLYNARVHPGEHVRVFPISNWTELDVWQYIARERLVVPSIYYAHLRPIVRRRGALVPVTGLTPPREGETVEEVSVRFRTVGDITCTAPVASTAADARGDHRRDRGRHHHRARRDPPRRPDQRRVDGTAQEGGVLLMSASETPELLEHGVLRFLTAGSVDDGKSTLIGRLLYDTKAVLADQLAAIERTSRASAARRSTCRCSPTASPPSASRASPSTSPTATSRPRCASSSSPTRRGTSSTRATW